MFLHWRGCVDTFVVYIVSSGRCIKTKMVWMEQTTIVLYNTLFHTIGDWI